MTTASPISENEKVRILSALRAALPGDPELTIDETKVLARGDRRHIPVVPGMYPEDKWAFLSGLAAAEIALADEGLRVRLEPAYAQRMLVVTGARGRPPFAYTTHDGSEYRDRARILGLSEDDPSWAGIEGYLYDTDSDLEQVLREARDEYPNADFSRVSINPTSSVT